MLFPYVIGFTALLALFSASSLPANLSILKLVQFMVVALVLPLLPLHGLYVAAVVRFRGFLAVGLTFLMPAAGLYGLSELMRGLPAEFLTGIRMLALFSALFGSLKALAQTRVTPLLAYAGVAFYSVLWWHAAGIGALSTQGIVFAVAVLLVTGGLLLATYYLQVRYGLDSVDRIGGLARPMPRFTILLTLLTMAAVGLSPFGLFAGYAGILLRPPTDVSWELVIIAFTQFAACFYLFRRMQRILFGPHRTDIPYEDLSSGEGVALSIVLLMLVILGLAPYGLFDFDALVRGHRNTMGMITWLK